jgi:hypothetical protein
MNTRKIDKENIKISVLLPTRLCLWGMVIGVHLVDAYWLRPKSSARFTCCTRGASNGHEAIGATAAPVEGSGVQGEANEGVSDAWVEYHKRKWRGCYRK